MPGTAKFDRSVELKRIFNRELDKWRRKHGGGLEDLAALCGVSPAYLAHVKRYGRIPGKPVLILLALHFELKNPEIFFHAAGIEGAFPFSQAVRIEKLDSAKDQLFSFSLNSEALALSIRDAIRQELSGTSQSEFTSSSTIRLGLNVEQSAFFGEDTSQGFFPELIDMLSTNLRCKIDTIPIPRSEYRTKIKSGKIDIYGPILPDFPSQGVLFTKPFCRLGRSALVRKNFVDSLEDLPQPQTMDCLAQHPYKIAVIRDSREHVFANITLQKRDSELVICDSIEEAVERLTMTSIPRTAHLFICNSLTAIAYQEKHVDSLDIAFAEHDSVISMSDCCLAIRPDWQQRTTSFDQAILYLIRNGALARSIKSNLSEKMREVVEISAPETFLKGNLASIDGSMRDTTQVSPL